MNEIFYDMVINKTSAERSKLEPNGQHSQGFKFRARIVSLVKS
jgi:hypothetical protein